MSGYWPSDCFGNGFPAFGEALDQARHTSSPSPRAGAQDNFRGELDKGNFFEDMKEKKFPRNGLMGIWGVGHGRVSSSRGVLETGVVFGRQRKRVKVIVGQGSKGCIAGCETNSSREFRVRLRWLVGIWEVGHGRVSRWML